MQFARTVILRPGLIFGTREESGPLETGFRYVAGFLGRVNSSLKDPWAQDASVIGQTAVNAGLKALNGDVSEKVWILHRREILELGK